MRSDTCEGSGKSFAQARWIRFVMGTDWLDAKRQLFQVTIRKTRSIFRRSVHCERRMFRMKDGIVVANLDVMKNRLLIRKGSKLAFLILLGALTLSQTYADGPGGSGVVGGGSGTPGGGTAGGNATKPPGSTSAGATTSTTPGNNTPGGSGLVGGGSGTKDGGTAGSGNAGNPPGSSSAGASTSTTAGNNTPGGSGIVGGGSGTKDGGTAGSGNVGTPPAAGK
jgi:hypothetical protein